MINSTIIPKKRQLSCGCFDFAFSKNKCKTHATIDNTNKRLSKPSSSEKSKVRGLLQYQKELLDTDEMLDLKIDLDRVVSRYVRLKEANSNGIIQCYTCPKVAHYLKMQCSHFIPRTHLATRWLIDNLRPACKTCNETLHGNLEVYAKNLEVERKGTVEYLNELKHTIEKPSKEELKQLLSEYQFKLRLVEQKIK
jgi:5-methylcytosine-specific restriction endonuclease McrA